MFSVKYITISWYIQLLKSEVAEMLFVAETDRPIIIINTDSDDYVFTLNKKKRHTLKKNPHRYFFVVLYSGD